MAHAAALVGSRPAAVYSENPIMSGVLPALVAKPCDVRLARVLGTSPKAIIAKAKI